MTEYFLTFWGGAEEAIEKELGISQKSFWFKTQVERYSFKKSLEPFRRLGLVFREEQGELTHKRTVLQVTLCYDGKIYQFDYDFEYEYPSGAAEWMFEEGNFSCDCNKSLFIQRHCDSSFPLKGCGDLIKLVSLKLKLMD